MRQNTDMAPFFRLGSAYVLRRDYHEDISPWLWGNHFWSPSYCAVSTGGASLDVVKNYVQKQKRPT
jgi:putative transposase